MDSNVGDGEQRDRTVICLQVGFDLVWCGICYAYLECKQSCDLSDLKDSGNHSTGVISEVTDSFV
eukprot:scaffold5200_cov165-Ochromonas_danica.AAC.3